MTTDAKLDGRVQIAGQIEAQFATRLPPDDYQFEYHLECGEMYRAMLAAPKGAK